MDPENFYGWVVGSTNYRVNLQVQTWDLRMTLSIYGPFSLPELTWTWSGPRAWQYCFTYLQRYQTISCPLPWYLIIRQWFHFQNLISSSNIESSWRMHDHHNIMIAFIYATQTFLALPSKSAKPWAERFQEKIASISCWYLMLASHFVDFSRVLTSEVPEHNTKNVLKQNYS